MTSIAFSILITVILGTAVSERISGLKHFQQLCGMRLLPFWLSNYILDLIKLEITVAVSLVAFEFSGLNYRAVWAPFLIFPFAIVPFLYVTSFLFTDDSAAQTFTFGFQFFIMCLVTTIVQALRVITSVWHIGDNLSLILKLFPSYCLTQAIFTDGSIDSLADYRKNYGLELETDLWSLRNVGSDCVALAAHSVVWVFVLVLIESNWARKLSSRSCCRRSSVNTVNEETEESVLRE